MQRSEFHYQLPVELIAQQPLPDRATSRLLCLDGEIGKCSDRRFAELSELLHAGDLLVFNDTRVIPARLYGQKDSGGKVECLVERITGNRTALMQIRASKSPRAGSKIHLDDETSLQITDRDGDFYDVEFTENVTAVLECHGHVPLPPYIQRDDELLDRERYQTIFAEKSGAVAAPTAGLHFDEEMLEKIRTRDIETARLTLHVGAGTFQPVRTIDIVDHVMHPEWYNVDSSVVDAIAAARERNGRVIAVGTTVVRTLETIAKAEKLQAGSGQTDIFIYPGYRFRCIDAMITNFHLPESTLLMLVCAFAGKANVLAAYQHAIEMRYRFFSYGDAMFVTPQSKARHEIHG